MVNTGRPSGGCSSCRDRKVKCNEQKPSCGRCTRLKISCNGYLDPWLLSLRQQNTQTAELVRKRVEKVQRRRAEERGLLVPLTRTISAGPEAPSLVKFFADYTRRSSIMFLECLPDKYASLPATYLSDAIDATAMASLARQQYQAGLMSCAKQSYGRAISSIRVAIQDESLMKEDSVLITLFVLGLFQAIAAEYAPHQSPNNEPGCQPHASGALAVLRYRAEHRMTTLLDLGLLALFREIRLMDLFMTPRRVPPLWYELDTFIDSLDNGPSLEPLVRQAVNFRIQFLSLSLGFSGPKVGQGADIWVPAVLKHGLMLSQGLEEAAEAIFYVDNHGTPPPTSFGGYIAVTCVTNAAIARSLYLTVRLHILEMVSEVIDAHCPEYCPAQLNVCACTGPLLREMTKALESVPPQEEPGMGLRAFSLFWPMTATLRSALADGPTKIWVKQKLLEVGTTAGFGLSVTRSKGQHSGDELRA